MEQYSNEYPEEYGNSNEYGNQFENNDDEYSNGEYKQSSEHKQKVQEYDADYNDLSKLTESVMFTNSIKAELEQQMKLAFSIMRNPMVIRRKRIQETTIHMIESRRSV